MKRSMRSAFAAVVATVAVLGGLTVVAEAQQGAGPNADCVANVGLTFDDIGFDSGRRIYSDPGRKTAHTYSLATPIPPGTYVVEAVSYDGYVGRENDNQPNEQWFAEFSANGDVLATTGTTGDVADGVPEAFWSGGIGTVTLAVPAERCGPDVVIVRHRRTDNAAGAEIEEPCISCPLLSAATGRVVRHTD